MKSRLLRACYTLVFGIALSVLVVGTSPNGFLSKEVSMVDPIESIDQDNNIVIIIDDDVPLATKPTKTTKTTTKKSVKKKKMKTKAKKTRKITKVSTKKSNSSNYKNGVSTKINKTVKTTVDTATKKASKIKTITTTVKTTTVTTKVVQQSGTVDVKELASRADKEVVKRFVEQGYKLKIDSSVNYAGVFRSQTKEIVLQKANNVVYHELGHFLAYSAGRVDSSPEFRRIFVSEKEKYTASNRDYVLQGYGEYFAESYKDYVENAAKLKSQRPKTYEFIQKTLASY